MAATVSNTPALRPIDLILATPETQTETDNTQARIVDEIAPYLSCPGYSDDGSGLTYLKFSKPVSI